MFEALIAAALVMGFIETEGRRRRKEFADANRKLDLVLKHLGLDDQPDADSPGST